LLLCELVDGLSVAETALLLLHEALLEALLVAVEDFHFARQEALTSNLLVHGGLCRIRAIPSRDLHALLNTARWLARAVEVLSMLTIRCAFGAREPGGTLQAAEASLTWQG